MPSTHPPWSIAQSTITDPALKQSAQERRARLSRAIDDVDAAMKEADADLTAYTNALADMQIYLANDLTPAGIQAAREKIQLIRRDASSISDKLSRVVAALDKTAPEFKTAKPPPPAPNAAKR